jgi:hypothetical protein
MNFKLNEYLRQRGRFTAQCRVENRRQQPVASRGPRLYRVRGTPAPKSKWFGQVSWQPDTWMTIAYKARENTYFNTQTDAIAGARQWLVQRGLSEVGT